MFQTKRKKTVGKQHTPEELRMYLKISLAGIEDQVRAKQSENRPYIIDRKEGNVLYLNTDLMRNIDIWRRKQIQLVKNAFGRDALQEIGYGKVLQFRPSKKKDTIKRTNKPWEVPDGPFSKLNQERRDNS